MSLIFRNKFAKRLNLGKKRKFLSNRTLKFTNKYNCVSNILVIDLNYLDSLHLSEIRLLDLLSRLFYRVLATKVYFIASDSTLSIVTLLNRHNFPIIITNYCNFSYTLKIGLSNKSIRFYFLTNDFVSWIFSDTSSTNFICIDSNKRFIIYNNFTGLEFLSKFISTNKLINKLKLDSLKYLNLQYLFCLLLYIKYTRSSKDEHFYFDTKYFISNFNQTNSTAFSFGLSLLKEAHKFLSYPLLTKPEFLTYFLLTPATNLETQFSRLLKLLPIDLLVLMKFKDYYSRFAPIQLSIDILLSNSDFPVLTTTNKKLNLYSILLANPTDCILTYPNSTHMYKLLKKLSRSIENISIYMHLLPKSYKFSPAEFDNSSIQTSKPTDNIANYVDKLFNERFK